MTVPDEKDETNDASDGATPDEVAKGPEGNPANVQKSPHWDKWLPIARNQYGHRGFDWRDYEGSFIYPSSLVAAGANSFFVPFVTGTDESLQKELEQARKEQKEAYSSWQAAEKRASDAATGQSEAVKSKEAVEQAWQNLRDKHEALLRKQELAHVISRILPEAGNVLLENEEFRAHFERHSKCMAYVMSVDIRGSTTLMKNALSPEDYAGFIEDLGKALENIILSANGVFDKFTGDGVLCFFPDFYSGGSGGLLAIDAATQCHHAFEKVYETHAHRFSPVMVNTGLGIGIDYGRVHIEPLWGGLTVVGHPVVYACRLGGAPAGVTLLNMPAYRQLLEMGSGFLEFRRTELEIKGEGAIRAYEVRRNEKPLPTIAPGWLRFRSGLPKSSDAKSQPPK
jgi:class 3 adenylate cyclase